MILKLKVTLMQIRIMKGTMIEKGKGKDLGTVMQIRMGRVTRKH